MPQQPAEPPSLVIDEIARVIVREELRRKGKSVAELGRVLGIEQGPAHRRLTGSYAWRLSDLLVVGKWLGVDLVNEITTMWKTVMAGAAELGAVRPDAGDSSSDKERGPVRASRRRSPAA
jgi:hypothetical protein